MAELGTPQSHRDVSFSLSQIGGIEEARGDLDGALTHYEEAMEIDRALMAELETPQSRRDVSFSLERIGGIARERGDLDGALAHFEEGLEITRQLSEDLGTSAPLALLNSLVWEAQLCAGIEISRARAEAALVRLESFVDQASILESAPDANTLDTAAAYWECRADALEALGRSTEAAESRSRALAIRARIAEMDSD
jgi:tetratricopeptide (TPR) repeat protein